MYPDPSRRPQSMRTMGHWPMEMDVVVEWTSGRMITCQTDFADAGASRLCYVGREYPLAFKFQDAGYSPDDSAMEYKSKAPTWLIPEVHGYIRRIEFKKVQVSLLVVAKCAATLQALGIMH